ncbi:MAG TPA: hypothetical protein VJ739_04710 [Gemmataceae bacterium]|nr:hypothetical protein [Gemmataceae bacterium]
MPWVIGIDEAGYGPNLGPLVMTSVACRVPDDLAGADLWRVLAAAVRRAAEADDGRPLVADSKEVYSAARGLAPLETGVLSLAAPEGALHLAGYLDWVSPPAAAELAGEPWYSGSSPLPVAADRAACAAAGSRFADVCRASGVERALVRSVVVCPARFNGLLDRWDSKGAVLGDGLAELVACNRAAAGPGAALAFFIDKHGGRNAYAPLLQDAIPDGMVLAREEGGLRSTYTVLGTGQDLRLTFQPRADAEHFCVALASMVSKYLREVLMAEFNRFWQAQVPGLRPTAGYPGDAPRFLAAIRPALTRLGIAESAVWRRK